MQMNDLYSETGIHRMNVTCQVLRAALSAILFCAASFAKRTEDADKEECGEVVNQFLDSDPTLQKWMSAESGCRDIASAVEDWGRLPGH